MENGDLLLQAIRHAESGTLGRIHIHFSRKWREKDPRRSALSVLNRLSLSPLERDYSVLLYFNPRRRKYAILSGPKLLQVGGPKYLENLAFMLEEDLNSTHIDNAIRLAIQTLGVTFKKNFPRKSESGSLRHEAER
jgi:hypothetical protein